MKRATSGAALVFAVLLSIALLGLGHALLIAARFATATADAGARQLRLRAEAEGRVRRALAEGSLPWMDSVPIGEARVGEVDDGDTAVRLSRLRLSRELWLLEARVSDAHGAAGAGTLLRVADPSSLFLELPGVVSVHPDAVVAASGTIDEHGFVGSAEACPPWSTRLFGAFSSEPPPPVGILTASVDTRIDSIIARAAGAVVLTPVGTPAPRVVDGACSTWEPWTWGDAGPLDTPCRAHLPVRRTVGSVAVEGGVGTVLLVVDGDLEIQGGADLRGLVLAQGVVSVRDSSGLTGVVVARGGVRVEPGASIVGALCPPLQLLAANRHLLDPPVRAHSAARLAPR